MENRKFVKFLVPAVMLGLFVLTGNVLAYGVETHAYLTDEVVNFYNKQFPNQKISEELRPYLVDGARREDDLPRWMNHFYDPVNDKGLASVYGNGYKSKEWAEDPTKQDDLKYKVTTAIASILTAIQQRSISAITTETDFTWERAIKFYVQGNKEKAMFILGHILHLIEDASVPDHTRNDAHPGWGEDYSPYENFAKKFDLTNKDKNLASRLQGKKPTILNDLKSYFDSQANYSNNNFYSKDTIGLIKYKSPEPDYFKIIGDYTYGMETDREYGDYKLFMRKKSLLSNIITNTENVTLFVDKKGGDVIMQDYWSRLSTKAVQHGAGVINLFFQEAEKVKNDQNKSQSFLGFIFGLLLPAPIPVEEFALDQNSESVTSTASALSAVKQIVEPVVVQPKPQPPAAPKPTSVQTPTPAPQPATFQECTFATTKSPTRQNIIINEVAWMGTEAGASNEWIELKNISGAEVDISGWQLIDQAEQITVAFKNIKISAGGFYLLERTDDSAIPTVKADLIYVGALSNTGEGLRLFDNKCSLIDEAMANPEWPAGDSATKRTMERNKNDLNWHTSSPIGGTPKAENSEPYQPAASGGFSAPPPVSPTPPPAPPLPPPAPLPTSTPSSVIHVVIGEIRAGTDNGAEDEFVELYNPTDQAINMAGWSLKKKSSTGSESNLVSSGVFSGTIAPKSFFLIAHQNYNGSIAADLIYSANSNNLAYANNSVVLYDANGAIVDEVAYGDIEKNKSLERKAHQNNGCVSAQGSGEFLGNGCDTDASADFELRVAPNPQNKNSLPEPRIAPAAIQNFNIFFSSSSVELILNWGESADFSGSTSTTIYELQEYNSPGVAIYNGSSTIFKKSITEVGRQYKFSVRAFDRDGLASAMTEKEIAVPSFWNNLYFYQTPTSSIYGGEPVIELQYDSFSFLPPTYSSVPEENYHYVIFYLNSEPETDGALDVSTSFLPKNTENILKTVYGTCGFSPPLSHNKLELAFDITVSNCAGGWGSGRMLFEKIGAKALTVIAEIPENFGGNFNEDDYVTAAFYGRATSGANESLGLIAVDKTHYPFKDESPEHASPRLSSDLLVQFNKTGSSISVGWNAATDEDTPQNLITYEINFSTLSELQENNWQDVGAATSSYKIVVPGDFLLVGVRAKDELGNYSETKTIQWSYPMPKFYIEQLQDGNWSWPWGGINTNCRPCVENIIDVASYQSITPKEDFVFNKIILKIQQGIIENGTVTARLALYEDDGGKPNLNMKIAESVGGVYYSPNFIFPEPVEVKTGRTYWLVLDAVDGHFRRSDLQNAISVSNPYADGLAGFGPAKTGCTDDNYCQTQIPYPTESADWYMRIGYEP